MQNLVLLLKGISKTIKNESKKQKGEFISMLLGTLDAGVLRNISAGKPKLPGQGVIRAGEVTNATSSIN